MSLICQNFESNAWRKDLCSHCFKSKEEHENPQKTSSADSSRDSVDLKRYQSPASSMLLTRNYAGLRGSVLSNGDLSPQASENTISTKVEHAELDHVKASDPVNSESVNMTGNGILRKDKVVREKREVKFHEDVVEIIGFGGDEEFFSDEEEHAAQHDAAASDSEDDIMTEEERHMQTVTQKNTSFNSVSRNLLESDLTKPAVRGFVSHGVTRPGETKMNSTPLVTIRPFGKDARPLGELKVNLVSPMRNGEIVAAEKLALRLKNTNNQVDPVKAPEKITSFSTSVPESKDLKPPSNPQSPSPSLPTAISVVTTKDSTPVPQLEDSDFSQTPSPSLPAPAAECGAVEKMKSRDRPTRPVLSRKPPVLKEKPRIPIKPQPAAATRPEKVENSTVLQGADNRMEPSGTGEQPAATVREKAESPSCLDTGEPQDNTEVVFTSVVSQEPLERTSYESQTQSAANEAKDSSKSVAGESHETSDPSTGTACRENEIPNQEVDAVKRLDSLFSKDAVQTEAVKELRSVKTKPAPPPPSGAAASRCGASRTPPNPPASPIPVAHTDSVDASPVQPVEISRDSPDTSESNSARLMSRSAFEALRANLAGSLELSRLHSPRLSTTKRQAPSPPTNSGTDPIAVAGSSDKPPPQTVPEIELPAESFSLPDESSTDANSIDFPERIKVEEQEKERRYRSSSASPAPRKTSFGVLVSFAPDAHEDDVDFSRSVSLSRLESDRSNVTPKPPSIRKMIKERAVQLFNNVNSNKSETPQGRMSRCDLFARDGKKPRNRFSLRKLLGLKSDSKNGDKKEQPTEIIYAKSRPEIIHPLDLHCGDVEVVNVKPEELNINNIGIYTTCPKLSHSTQDLSLGSQASSTTTPNSSTSTTKQPNRNSAGRPRPPPPPRMNSRDKNGSPSNLETPLTRPSRPPPPKTGDPDLVHVAAFGTPNSEDTSQYANLGNTRSSLTPRKPERTASLRSVNKPDIGRPSGREPVDEGLHYECVPIKTLPSPGEELLADNDGYVIPLRMRNASFSSTQAHRHSLSSFTSLKNINKENDYSSPLVRSGRPSLRQSRVDLHTSLEDHYGTVTGANLQALTQLMEQANRQKFITPAHLHSLTTKNVKWKNLEISTEAFVKRRRVSGSATFLNAKWEGHDVLLLIHELGADSHELKIPFRQPGLVSFEDHIPHYVTRKDASRLTATVHVTIDVYPPGEVVTLPALISTWTNLKDVDSDEYLQKFLVIFVQILRVFVSLAAKGKDATQLENIIFFSEAEDVHPRLLCMGEDRISEYENLHFGITSSVPNDKFTFLEASLKVLHMFQANRQEVVFEKLNALLTSRSHTRGLEKAKSFTEFNLFGPHEEILAKETESRLDILRKWLDIERASFLNDVIQSHGLYNIKLSLIEELNLAFLVETSCETLLEASQ